MLVMGSSGLVNWWPRRGQWRAGFAVARAQRLSVAARAARRRRDLGSRGVSDRQLRGVYLAFPESVRGRGRPGLAGARFARRRHAVRVEPVAGATPARHRRRRRAGARQVSRTRAAPGLPADQARSAVSRRADPGRRRPAVAADHGIRRSLVAARRRGVRPAPVQPRRDVLAWQHALHAGQGLGPVWKLLVFLSGFLPLLFAVTGLAMWLLKRRRRQAPGRPAYPRSSVYGAEGRRMRIVCIRSLLGRRCRGAFRPPPRRRQLAPAAGIVRGRLAARSVRLEHVLVGRQRREDGDRRAGDRLGRYLDRRARQSDRTGCC